LTKKVLTSFRTWRFIDKFTTSHTWNLSWVGWTHSSSSRPISSGLSRNLYPTTLWTEFCTHVWSLMLAICYIHL